MSPILGDGSEDSNRPRVLAAMVAMFLLGALTLAWASSDAWGQTPTTEKTVDEDPSGLPYAAGELLVTYKPEADAGAKEKAKRTAKGRVEKELPEVRAQLVSLPEVKSRSSQGARKEALEEAKRTIEQDPAVEAAEYNYLRQASYAPNDASFGKQYGLTKANFPNAWDKTRGERTKIAVVDSGIDAGHPDLKSKVAVQKDFVNGDGVADDEYGHGTHVAGIAAAATGNGLGVAGGCPDCGLLVAKTIGKDGSTTIADEIDGIRWSINNGAKVINLSLSGTGKSRAEEEAVNYAWSKGAVVVAAAGNANASVPEYPAAYRRAIAVAATDGANRRASFSNHGRWVDVSAPGVDILSTVPRGYGPKSGTSMASPHVSALAGLLASQGRSGEEVRTRILGTATDLGPQGRDPTYGAGRIDAARAVRGGAPK